MHRHTHTSTYLPENHLAICVIAKWGHSACDDHNLGLQQLIRLGVAQSETRHSFYLGFGGLREELDELLEGLLDMLLS